MQITKAPESEPLNLAPLPISKGHWLLKNLPSMLKDVQQHFYNKGQELGPTFENPMPNGRVIATADPEFIRYVLQTHYKYFTKARGGNMLKLLLGNGLVSSVGDFWQQQRKLIQSAFYKKNLEGMFEIMGSVTAKYLDDLSIQNGKVIDVDKEMMRLTAEIVLKAMFSDETPEDLNQMNEAVGQGQKYVMDRIINPFSSFWYKLNGRTKKFGKNKAILDAFVLKLINKRRNSQEKYPDLLQLLMDATYEDSNERMNDQQLLDEMITIFVAGHETSSNALTWTLYLLSQHPDVVRKIRIEASAIVGDKLPSFQDLRQLTYARQVLDESMRLFPPVWGISRKAVVDNEFRGIKINKGDTVYNLIYNVHHREDLYENPKSFRPERFAPEKMKSMPKMSYMPFGGGRRLCIGNSFALMEMQLILVGLLQRFDFELVENQKIEMEPLITVGPKYGMKMKIKDRSVKTDF